MSAEADDPSVGRGSILAQDRAGGQVLRQSLKRLIAQPAAAHTQCAQIAERIERTQIRKGIAVKREAAELCHPSEGRNVRDSVSAEIEGVQAAQDRER